MDVEKMKERIVLAKIGKTKISRKLSYVDQNNKVVFSFTERAGCTLCFQSFCDMVGLLQDAKAYHPWIHRYRLDILTPLVPRFKSDQLAREGYIFIKFVINPYRRAVSCFHIHHHKPHRSEFTFRTYLKKRLSDPEYFDDIDKAHHAPQYEEKEEKYIHKYICIHRNETYTLTKFDGSSLVINPNRFDSIHHVPKHSNKPEQTEWSWPDVHVKDAVNAMPVKYKCFYDTETKKLVEQLYHDDIVMYPFMSFDEDF